MIVKRRYFVRKDKSSEIRERLRGILEDFPGLWPKGRRVEIVETDEALSLILIDGKPILFEIDGRYFPTLKSALDIPIEKKFVTVDEGAVRFVVNGADIMRPGIVDFDKGIEEGDVVIVVEERHRKPLAIGVSMFKGEDLEEMTSGKCIKNVHYVGDKIWETLKKI
jgi:PUA domain protein